MSYGAQVKFGIGRQASVNSWITTAGSFHAMGILNDSIGMEFQELISQNLNGTFQQGASYQGLTNVTGTVEAEATPRNLAILLAAVVNHAPAAVPSGTALVNYTFLPNTVDFSSTFVKAPFSVYKQFSDASSAELYYDCQFSQLDLAFSAGEFFKVKGTLGGGTRLATGIGSLNVFPNAADIGREFPWSVSSVSYGGTGLSNFSDITVSLNEQVEPLFTMNASLAPFKFTRKGFREVTVNGTFYMNDRTFLNNFVGQTQARLILTAMNTLTTIQSGYYDTFTVDIPQLKITQFKMSVTGPGEVAVKFTGRGVADPSSNYVAQFTLQNTYTPGY
jgi:hypothetical protein